MSSRNLLGRNAYAAHRGCSPNAVRKAELSGRIAAACIRDDQGVLIGIDARLADQLWRANTDPAMQRRPMCTAPEVSPVPEVQAPGPDADALEALALRPAFEAAMLSLPRALAQAGLDAAAIELALGRVLASMRRDLIRRCQKTEACDLLEGMLREELAQPGSWTE